ncbi:hypothetical protein [Niastella populi]|uniref:Uncharacterized protein n=1 Tax=Niastella populi TaxID=550983 RepID=A0A1V9GBW5_9BACT|nr:hypothetical protein [Niastella populi]OQP67936.1 hypothetical protein A4R26_10570 [Niastella populi]
MNFKHPYEKHLAEKLVQHPPPDDPDQNWQQMKMLLDKNMPRGGGGPFGSYRWWVAGTIIFAIVAGTWFGGKTLLSKKSNESVAGTIKTVNSKNVPSVASTEKNVEPGGASSSAIEPNGGGTTKPDNNLPGAAYTSTSGTAGKNPPVTNGEYTETDNSTGSKKDIAATNKANQRNSLTIEEAERARSSGNNENAPNLLTGNSNSKGATETPSDFNNKTSVDRNKIYTSGSKNGKVKTGNNTGNNNRTANNRTTGNRPGRNLIAGNENDNRVAENTGNSANKGKNTRRSKPQQGAAADIYKPERDHKANNRGIYVPKITLPSQPSSGSELKESPVIYHIDYTGASVIAPSGVLQREFTYYTEADLFPDKVAKNKTSKSKSSRNAHSQEDKMFAVGLSLPMGFPVGDQAPLGYNRNGGANTISDYIPSPHFQFHFNNKTYVQAGLQFSAPQFIRPVLMYQDKQFQPGPNWFEEITSITARKLYYFNLPLTIYHSPLKNFYMGTGLQYSSLLSGIAHYEKVKRIVTPVGPAQEYVVEDYYTRFRNDSLSRLLNGNELRLLVDMSYYWSRFTVGLQYSQAFNNYVSFQVTPASAYQFDKNKSLQFYLRYNIWEDKKRKKSKGQSLLTLK